VPPTREPDLGVEATDASAGPSRAVVVVAFGPGAPRLPEDCAGCGETATAHLGIGFGSRALAVPYCGRCRERASLSGTRALSTALASWLLAGTFAAGAPLLWPWAAAAVVTLAAVLVSATPWAVDRWVLPRLFPRAAAGRAVFRTIRGELACRRPAFAERIAALNPGARLRAVRRSEPLGPGAVTGPIVALIAGPALHWLHHPLVRVLDLMPDPIVVEVDGRRVAEVVGSSREDPAAGVELRLPAGRRRIVTRTRRGEVATNEVLLRSGRLHLFAPGPHEQCFWLETTSYGRLGSAAVERVVLPPDQRFWVLPAAVDAWFVENPPGPGEGRSSGGQRTALRQGRCRDVPGASTRGP